MQNHSTTFACKQCGKDFKSTPRLYRPNPNPQFCSRDCYHIWSREHGNDTVKCKQCDKSFKVRSTRQAKAQFCSYDCRRAWNEAQGKRPIKQVCQQCGKEFKTHKSVERLYCSKECYWKSKELTEQRTCPVCNKTFEVWPSEPNRLCSRACRDIWIQKRDRRTCKQCGKAFTVHHHRTDIYCSQSCAARANNPRKTDYPIHVCAKCGKEFEHTRGKIGGKYCSRVCSDAVKKNPPAQEWIPKPCAFCGNVFLCPPWYDQICCSIKCSKRLQAQTMRGDNHPLWKERVEVVCEVCGKVCEVQPFRVKTFRACSHECGTVLAIRTQQHGSSIERKMEAAMHQAGLEATPQYPIGPFVVDFAFVEQRLAVECDGDYWHNTPRQKVKDKRRDGYLKHNGWRVVRLPEHYINSDIDECIQEISAILHSIA